MVIIIIVVVITTIIIINYFLKGNYYYPIGQMIRSSGKAASWPQRDLNIYIYIYIYIYLFMCICVYMYIHTLGKPHLDDKFTSVIRFLDFETPYHKKMIAFRQKIDVCYTKPIV